MDTKEGARQGTPKRHQPTLSQTNVSSIFWAMACDLKLDKELCVQKAYSLLSGGKYASFLTEVGTWVQQLQDPSPDIYYRWSQLANLLKKFPFDDPVFDRRKTALDKFFAAEHRCKRYNAIHRLRRERRESPFVHFARRWIAETLGSFSWGSVFRGCDFGPGMVVKGNRDDLSFQGKLDCLTVTPALLPVASAALLHNHNYCEILAERKDFTRFCYDSEWFATHILNDVQVLQYNKLGFVPKTAKENRVIATPLSLNGFVQKGIGTLIESRLRSVGLDIKNQGRNQHFARLGSLHGTWSTIDLSSASDSISIELARTLLPDDWFTAMNLAREPAFLLDNEVIRYEKFCSMGNGFCFPLQTLIFASAAAYARSVAHRGAFCVYGDDIIVPTGNFLLVKECLEHMGFRLNVDKSFAFGPFRESCGADYHSGVQVRSVYIDKPILHPANLYPLLNHLRRKKMQRTWAGLFDLVPEKWRFLTPYRSDDSNIEVDLDTFMSSSKSKWNRETMSWDVWRAVSTPAPGARPRTTAVVVAGKMRGDLIHSDVFSVRNSTRTRRLLGHRGMLGPKL